METEKMDKSPKKTFVGII